MPTACGNGPASWDRRRNWRICIEVYFDFICPWCLIGRRQLDEALAQLRVERPEVRVDVSWRGVQLLPALPMQGEDFHAFYLRRLGSEQGPRMPNTADAHRLWQRACQLGSPAQLESLLEWLFACHFLHGGDLGDGATLLGLAEAVGFSPADLVGSLQGDGTPFFCDQPEAARQGVPSFVLGKGRVLSGAQPVAQLLAGLHQAVAAMTRAQARVLVPAERVPAPGQRVLIEDSGKSLVLFNVDGRFHAIDDGCPHQGASLCGGRLEGEVIQCLAHGLRFNLTTGLLLNSTQLRVRRYPVEPAGEGLSIVIESQEAIPCSP